MTRLTIETVADDTAAGCWHSVEAAVRAADHVGLPADPVEELLPLLAGEVAGERVELSLGTADGDPVVAGAMRLPLHDNLTAAALDVLVHPRHRRRGHGRAMADHLLARARIAGRSRVFVEIAEPLDGVRGAGTSAGAALAASYGARSVLGEVRRLLDLTAVDPARLAGLRAEAASRAGGYSLVQWVDRAPAEVLDDVAVLMGRMTTDAPMEQMDWEPEAWTADRYRTSEDAVLARGRRRVATAVRHDTTGRVVGVTDIAVNARRPEVAYQWHTIVAPGHRGHRLGLLLKVANLELLRTTVRGARLVNTWNAVVNTHMIAVNEALGFRPVERWSEWQLDLCLDSPLDRGKGRDAG